MYPLKFSFSNKVIFLLVSIGLISINVYAQDTRAQIWWRGVQLKNNNDTNRVVRVYLDKYGYFYPSVHVPMDSNGFYYPQSKNDATDTVCGNLFRYFRFNKSKAKVLFNYYHISNSGDFTVDYYAVQEKILQNYNWQIHNLIKSKHAKNIVFLVHGFNETDPTSEYQYFENQVTSQGYDKKVKPVYVEIFWDGLTTSRGDKFLTVWKHAQNNTRYVCLALRDLMRHITDRKNFVIVTHSLGASVGTGALFNCTSKWRKSDEGYVDVELDSIMRTTPAPIDVKVRLGMIVPAIPGYTTFVDFNNRSPTIKPMQNNIERVIIGYNPQDYATSKWFLAAKLGATTLGCDYGYPNSHDEISAVFRAMKSCGYPKGQNIVIPIHFTTPKKYVILQDHAFVAYMNDQAHFKIFLNDLFN